MKKIIVLLFVLLLAGCSSSTPAESASGESNVLKVGMECDYAPFNWTQVQDSDTAVSISSVDFADGYDVVMARRIAELIGKEVQIDLDLNDGVCYRADPGCQPHDSPFLLLENGSFFKIR